MNFAAVVGLCSVWATPFLRNNLQRHKRNQSAGDPLIEGETLFRVGHPPLILIPAYSSLHDDFTCTFRNNFQNQRIAVIPALRRSRTQWVKRRRCSFRPSTTACTSRRVPTG